MAKLPFFQFYPSDWIRDTQVLSLEAQGAWMKILCGLHDADERGTRTWTVEQVKQFLGFPEDDRALELIDQLKGVADIETVDSGDNYCEDWSEICEITITSRRMVRDERARKAKQDADLRYNEKRTKEKRSENDPETRDILHTTEVRDKKKKKSLKKSRLVGFPKDFKITEGIQKLCTEKGYGDPHLELDNFRDYHEAKGNKFVDWEVAFRKWMRKAKEFRPPTDADELERHKKRLAAKGLL